MKALGFEITFSEVEKVLRSWVFQLGCFAVAVLCWIMVVCPDGVVQRLQLNGLREKLGPWLGVLVVVSTIFFVGGFVRYLWLSFRASQLYKGKDADKRIARLSTSALRYLCDMFKRSDHGGRFLSLTPTIVELCDANALRCTSSKSGNNLCCYLQPWVVDWLAKHPEIIEKDSPKKDGAETEANQ